MDCFGEVIQQVAIYCEKYAYREDARQVALRLWTFVHGAASLLIDDDYSHIAPELDVYELVEEATPRLLLDRVDQVR